MNMTYRETIKSLIEMYREAGKLAIEGWKDLIFDLWYFSKRQVRP
jgi:hypothetical protein